MKKIEAIIRHSQLQDVIDGLISEEIHGLTCSKVQGFGRQHGHQEVYRGKTLATHFVDKTKIDVVVTDDNLEKALKIIMDKARTGEVGDGKIFVTSIENAYRIRTGEAGDTAI